MSDDNVFKRFAYPLGKLNKPYGLKGQVHVCGSKEEWLNQYTPPMQSDTKLGNMA